jgi:hypothetical protein
VSRFNLDELVEKLKRKRKRRKRKKTLLQRDLGQQLQLKNPVGFLEGHPLDHPVETRTRIKNQKLKRLLRSTVNSCSLSGIALI